MTDQVTPTPEETQVEAPQASEQTQEVEEVQVQEEVREQPIEQENNQHQPEQKQTRAEKRLQQLLRKGKPQNEDQVQSLIDNLPEVQPSEDGTYTPEQFQQLVAQETAKTVQLFRERDSYEQKVNTFISEVEEVGSQIDQDFKDSPDVANQINSILTKVLKASNVRIDENGKEVLVPTLSAKEAYQDIKNALNITETRGKTQATATLAQQVAEGAITPSTQQSEEPSFENMSSAEIFKNPTAVREALEKKLSKAS